MSSISAGTTSTTTLVHSGDTTGSLVFKTNDTGSGGTTAVTIDTSQRAAFVAGTAALPAITTAGDTNTGIYFPAADTIAFAEGGAEAMRIDSSGNVGIGTTSQNEKLVVNGAIRSTNNAVSATATADSGLFYFVPTADAPSDPRTMVQGVGTASVGASIAFLTGTSSSNTERMRIDSSGSVGIGVTPDTNYFLTVQSTSNDDKNAVKLSQGSTALRTQISFNNPNGQVGTIQTNGSATSYNTSSDYRLKENIAPMTGALAKVAQLKPVTYKWKVDGSDGEGFIAHELAEVKPDCVSGEKDAVDAEGKPIYQGIDTSFLVATLTAALQETKALIDQQAETINALTARVVALEGQ